MSMKYIPKGLIDNKLALVQVIAWRRAGDKSLPKPILAQFTDAYMRHYGIHLSKEAIELRLFDSIKYGSRVGMP